MILRPCRARFLHAASFGLTKSQLSDLQASLAGSRQYHRHRSSTGSFTLNLYQIPQGTGSGFVWDTNGNIITNFHVIQNAGAAQVTLADQSNWKAQIVGVVADKDLAGCGS